MHVRGTQIVIVQCVCPARVALPLVADLALPATADLEGLLAEVLVLLVPPGLLVHEAADPDDAEALRGLVEDGDLALRRDVPDDDLVVLPGRRQAEALAVQALAAGDAEGQEVDVPHAPVRGLRPVPHEGCHGREALRGAADHGVHPDLCVAAAHRDEDARVVGPVPHTVGPGRQRAGARRLALLLGGPLAGLLPLGAPDRAVARADVGQDARVLDRRRRDAPAGAEVVDPGAPQAEPRRAVEVLRRRLRPARRVVAVAPVAVVAAGLVAQVGHLDGHDGARDLLRVRLSLELPNPRHGHKDAAGVRVPGDLVRARLVLDGVERLEIGVN
mmetsp:Transcript_67337/g.189755  ORF Transcript_67337/g.189755 Transcript_67337/m.189755 type:complete len:330 (-) Transcript_67337:568-1557(-)